MKKLDIFTMSFISLTILFGMCFVQTVLATFLKDMLSGYQGHIIPGGDVSGPWFVMSYLIAMMACSLISFIIYVKSKTRLSNLVRCLLVILPYALPLYFAQDWIISGAMKNWMDPSEGFYSDAARDAARWSIFIVALFLTFQATIPHWIFLLGSEKNNHKL